MQYPALLLAAAAVASAMSIGKRFDTSKLCYAYPAVSDCENIGANTYCVSKLNIAFEFECQLITRVAV